MLKNQLTRTCSGCDGARRRQRNTAVAAITGINGDVLAREREAPIKLRELLEVTVASGFDIEGALLRLPSRGVARIALARQTLMYLGHVACGLTKAEVGRLFGRYRTTVHHACMVVEQRRDDRQFDQALMHLERIIRIILGQTEIPCQH